jgi:PAS domain S-box-containing protein
MTAAAFTSPGDDSDPPWDPAGASREWPTLARAWRERYEAAVEVSAQLVYDWDARNDAVILGGDVEGILGYDKRDLEGSLARWMEIVHPDDLARARAEAERAWQADGSIAQTYRVVRRDGRVIHCADRGRIFRDDLGRVTRVVGFVTDMTALRQAEEALRDSEQRFRLATEALLGMVYDFDFRTGTVWRSPGVQLLVGYPPEEVPNDTAWWNGLVHPADWAQANAAFAEAVAVRAPVVGTQYRVRHRDGREIWVWDQSRVLYDEDGQPARMVGCTISIDAQKRLEAERTALLEAERAARAEAERANRVKDEILAVISHELRTPLHAILGWTEMLKKGSLPPATAQKALEVIERNTRAQSQLIDDLLDVARIATGKLRVSLRAMSLAAAVEAALDDLRQAAAAKDIRLELAMAADPMHIHGDPARVEQIAWNLLSNAIKFSPRGRRVWIELAARHGDAVLTVRDEGDGMAPDLLPHVFERFRQGDSSSARRHGGLGLGLSIVRHLVELHGGVIRAESEGEGRGATFVATFPLAPAGEIVDSSRIPITEIGDLAGLRVLVVDDDADACELARRILGDEGAEITTAGSAAEALSVLTTGTFDVLISDLGMPQEDGFSLIRAVRRVFPDLPAIALTAFARAEDRTRAIEAGFDEYAAKPVDPRRLTALVAHLTGRRSRA